MSTWFQYNKGWLVSKHHKNDLIQFYEDAVSDSSTACKHIARFIGNFLIYQALSKVVSRFTREYMLIGDLFKSIWDSTVLVIEPFAKKFKPIGLDRFSQLP